jgi:hypothetical protein
VPPDCEPGCAAPCPAASAASRPYLPASRLGVATCREALALHPKIPQTRGPDPLPCVKRFEILQDRNTASSPIRRRGGVCRVQGLGARTRARAARGRRLVRRRAHHIPDAALTSPGGAGAPAAVGLGAGKGWRVRSRPGAASYTPSTAREPRPGHRCCH